MKVLEALGKAVGIQARDSAGPVPASILPPARSATISEPRGLAAVYRAIQVLTTSAAQLPIDVEKAGNTLTHAPQIVARPCIHLSRGDWVTHMVTGLALYGNAYALIERDSAGRAFNLRPLNPATVWVNLDPQTKAPRFGVEGRVLTAYDVLHAHLMPATVGDPFGLGPIQAARPDLVGARLVRDYAAQWFDGTGEPTGVLSSPSASLKEAQETRNAWNGLDPDGKPVDQSLNPTRVKVLGKGFTYQRLAINPKDAQWIESQEFSIVQIARLFGIPSTLALASPSGGSMTYSNVEQDWISFVRFTLMAYLRPLEDALTEATVRGQRVRFNLEGLLRTDTKTRYEAHSIGLAAGFLTIDEVRSIEGLPPLSSPGETA